MMPNPRLVSDFPPRNAPCGPGRYPNAMYERLRRFPGAGQNDRREGWKCNGTPHRKRLGWRRDHVPPAIGPVIRLPCCGARIGRMVGEQAAIHPRPARTASNPAVLYRPAPPTGPAPAIGPDTPGPASRGGFRARYGAGFLNTGRTGLFSGTPGGRAGSDTAGKSAAPARATTG